MSHVNTRHVCFRPRRFSPSTRRRHLGSTALRAVKSDGYVSQGGSLGEEIGPLLRRPLLTKDDEQRFGHRVQTLQVIEARRAERAAGAVHFSLSRSLKKERRAPRGVVGSASTVDVYLDKTCSKKKKKRKKGKKEKETPLSG